MEREVTKELLDEIQDGFNRHDVDAILSHFTEDCEWLMAGGPNPPEGRRCKGKAEIGEVAIQHRGGALAGFLNGVHWHFDAGASSGDNAVAHPL